MRRCSWKEPRSVSVVKKNRWFDTKSEVERLLKEVKEEKFGVFIKSDGLTAVSLKLNATDIAEKIGMRFVGVFTRGVDPELIIESVDETLYEQPLPIANRINDRLKDYAKDLTNGESPSSKGDVRRRLKYDKVVVIS